MKRTSNAAALRAQPAYIERLREQRDELIAALELIATECERMKVGEIGSIRPAEVARAAVARVRT